MREMVTEVVLGRSSAPGPRSEEDPILKEEKV